MIEAIFLLFFSCCLLLLNITLYVLFHKSKTVSTLGSSDIERIEA